jgi:hypothetical protein
MPVEIRKISDVGTRHPVVARLGVQTNELVKWLRVEEAQSHALLELYINTLTQRLLRCHECRDDLAAEMEEAVRVASEQNDRRAQNVPHVLRLEGIAEAFLYEAKNYLRDLVGVFQILYKCPLKDASAFADMKDEGQSKLLKWAIRTFGAAHDLSKMLAAEQQWVTEVVRKRNAVEHPGEQSGKLAIKNIELVPTHPGQYLPPRWGRTGCLDSSIMKDMDCILDNLLTLAEDLLVHVIKQSPVSNVIAFYEITPSERDPSCPTRLRMSLSPEFMQHQFDVQQG